MTQYLEADSIRVNTKKLRKLSAAKIKQYARAYEAGAHFPPILVVANGDYFTIQDGRHRYQAQLQAGFGLIEVDIRELCRIVAGGPLVRPPSTFERERYTKKLWVILIRRPRVFSVSRTGMGWIFL